MAATPHGVVRLVMVGARIYRSVTASQVFVHAPVRWCVRGSGYVVPALQYQLDKARRSCVGSDGPRRKFSSQYSSECFLIDWMTSSVYEMVAHLSPSCLQNAWMVSTAGHPFWMFLARMIMQRAHAYESRTVENATGPVILKQAVDLWRCMAITDDIVVLQPGFVYIKDWHRHAESARVNVACDPEHMHEDGHDEKCMAAYPNAHVLTSWSHTWGK